MKTSETIEKIIPALLGVNKELINIEKNETATIKSEKGSYTYGYASLPFSLSKIKPVLSKHNLFAVHNAMHFEDKIVIITRIYHISGEWIESHIPMVAKFPGRNINQEMGSLLSFGRRYGLNAILNTSSEEDTDANNLSLDDTQPEKKNNKIKIDFDEVEQNLKKMTTKQAMVKYFSDLEQHFVSEKQRNAAIKIFEERKKQIQAGEGIPESKKIQEQFNGTVVTQKEIDEIPY
jgi:hypothetical protein